ncbi:Ltp family lipoprotein [Listeria seeligeri]|uniref:Ltp family lipoprotein n=1 Tax=Listeria seeligeri TaxID=1640 RepID=UPI0030D7C23E
MAVGAIGSALGGNDTAADDTKNTEKEESIPSEYKSALKKAEQYSSMMKMSKAGIYDQLTSEAGEKFSAEAGKYAIDNLKADYNANALAKAEDYQKTMAMAPEAIRDQLTSSAGEKFTAEEADYAIQNLSK